ncbi:uncharacterized protein THITE_2108860 [Thermothielavioides terrestris NRRL 8126]|uniref:Uncharacterized protein n=2 Tax=Thermothielavioides terrestris TaxID=2587410 RepID=G2QSL7_THETT|nr:uncharacterized protein THITE_2108860 [Thermothielavioides terrestris NRRL 8126]AEO63499.1 hypothetical protein THITE_2108860 [Thermothielavioides terrestris NRRL 8126]
MHQPFAKTDSVQDTPKTNGTHAAPASRATTNSPHPIPSSNARKLLPEADKDRPIMRRKTAGNLPQFIAQQPTPKHSTPSSRGKLSTSPPSSQPLALRPSVHSPPASPVPSRDAEPAKKRLRLSPSATHSPQTGIEAAVGTRPSTADSDRGAKQSALTGPQLGRRPSTYSPHGPSKAPEGEGKPSSKPSMRHPVRKVPLELSNLRFIDEPEDPVPDVLLEQPGFWVNGLAGDVAREPCGEAASTFDGDGTDRWTGETRNPVQSMYAAHAELPPSPRQRQRTSELLNGNKEKVPPHTSRRSGTRATPGPLQATGSAIAREQKPPAQTEQSLLRPPPISKAHLPLLPKPKEVDISRFDALVYSQPGASTPPPGVDLALDTNPRPAPQQEPAGAAPKEPQAASQPPKPEADEPLYLDVDPRIHWPQPHSAAWHAAKQKEIAARGRRKDNFGCAAQSLRKQRREREKRAGAAALFEDALPEKVLENPAWVRALRRLKGLAPHPPASSSSSSFLGLAQEEGGFVANGTAGGGGYGGGANGALPRKGRKPAGGAGGSGGGLVARKTGPGMVVVAGLSRSVLAHWADV